MSRRAAPLAVLAITLAACSSGGGESGSSVVTAGSQPADLTTTSASATRGSASSVPASFELRLTEASIWAATNDAEVCSPIEPSASDLRVRSENDFELVVALWESADGDPHRRLLKGGADDGWEATIGPVRARRGGVDTTVDLTVAGYSADAADKLAELAEATPATAAEWADALEQLDQDQLLELADDAATATLEVLAPVRCAEGQRRDRAGRSKSNPELRIEAEFPDGLDVWASADGFCGDGPTVLGVAARTNGNPARVELRWVTASGSAGSQRMRANGTNRWRGDIGPLKASGSMPAAADLSVQVVAIDGDGNEASVSSLVTVRRPSPCDAAATTSTSPGAASTTLPPSSSTATTTPVTAPPAPTVEARTNVSEVWASGGNTCPAGPTSITVEARTTGAVTAVQMRATTANGGELGNKAMTATGANTWSASIGSITASGSMPESSQLTITVRATAGAVTVTDTVVITLRKPALCATTTTAAPTTAAPTTTAPTT